MTSTTNVNNQYIASEIVDNIIREARVDEAGISWETIFRSIRPGKFDRITSYGLGQGSLGIVLFLLTYYEKKKDRRLPEIIDLAIKKAYNHFIKHHDLVGFYYGRGGAIYVLLEAYRILDRQSYLKKATELGYVNVIPTGNFNLNHGLSGLLVGLLHLYNVSKDQQLQKKIKEVCLIIVIGAKVKPEGIYWDEHSMGMRPINGFLHGNSGVVFALREASKLFQDKRVFDNVISEAIQYEDASYCRQYHNWPDFLNEEYFIFNHKVKKRLAKKIFSPEYFYKPANTFSWATGSPGNLLVRKEYISTNSLYSKALSQTTSYFQSLQNRTGSDFSLYKGLGGIYLSLQHLGSNLENKSNSLTNGILAQKEKYTELLSAFPNNRKYVDLSLFRGESGIGYLLLMLNNSTTNKSSVLYPSINNDFIEDKKIYLTQPEVDTAIIQSNLPIKEFQQKIQETTKSFNSYIEKEIEHLSKTNNYNGQYRLIVERFRLMQKDVNFHYLNVKCEANKAKIIHKTPKYLSLNEHCKLVSDLDKTYLLDRSVGVVNITELNTFGAALLSLCCNEQSIIKLKDIENAIIKMTKAKDIQDKEYVRNKVNKMTNKFIEKGILHFK